MATQPPPQSVFQIRIPGGQNSPMFSSAGCSFLGLKAVLWIRIGSGSGRAKITKIGKSFKKISKMLDVLF